MTHTHRCSSEDDVEGLVAGNIHVNSEEELRCYIKEDKVIVPVGHLLQLIPRR